MDFIELVTWPGVKRVVKKRLKNCSRGFIFK